VILRDGNMGEGSQALMAALAAVEDEKMEGMSPPWLQACMHGSGGGERELA
jgi:hypothetical protein